MRLNMDTHTNSSELISRFLSVNLQLALQSFGLFLAMLLESVGRALSFGV